MKLFTWRSNERRHFIPVGRTAKKYSKGPRPRNPLKLLLWPFFRLFSKSNEPNDDATSPRTALMSFEELSGDDSESDVEVPMCSLLEQFPVWKETVSNESDDDQEQELSNQEAHRKGSSGRSITPRKSNSKKSKTLQPFKRLLAQRNDERNYGRSDDISDNDLDSQHFSISTDFHQAYRQPKDSSSATFDYCVSPSSMNWEAECEHTRVTLEKFMESSDRGASSRFHPMNLADFAADDNASVGSALLTVSYDEQYPQLVLQPSLDGTTGSKIGGGQSSAKLGAIYAHPAATSRRADSNDVQTEELLCSTEWIEENIEKVWEQIDFDLSNEGGFDELSSTSSTSENDPFSQWMEEAIEWSHSAGNSARSFTEMIEKEVVQPIIDFVESPQVGASGKGEHPRLRLVPHIASRTKQKSQRESKVHP